MFHRILIFFSGFIEVEIFLGFYCNTIMDIKSVNLRDGIEALKLSKWKHLIDTGTCIRLMVYKTVGLMNKQIK